MTENSGKDNDDIRKAMKPKRGSGPPPRIVSCQDERGEGKWNKILLLFIENKKGEEDHKKNKKKVISVDVIYFSGIDFFSKFIIGSLIEN